jgi:hypothetical protein
MLLLPEGQTEEAETFQKAMFVHISGALYQPVLPHIFQTALPADGYATTLNGPQSADSNLAIVYLLPFTTNRAPPCATNRFIQLTAGTRRPAQPVM